MNGSVNNGQGLVLAGAGHDIASPIHQGASTQAANTRSYAAASSANAKQTSRASAHGAHHAAESASNAKMSGSATANAQGSAKGSGGSGE
jgi:hypothetical protein